MKICRYCKHCKISSVPDIPCCVIECKKHFKISYITGFKIYEDCKNINVNGDCQEYEESWIRKLINKIFKYL